MHRILIVDDSRVMQRLVANVLAETGATLAFASDGVEAMASFRVAPADLVVSDVEMPGMGGVELAHLLRQEPGSPAKVILMSAGNAEAGRAAVLRGDADAFVPKPLDAGELRRIVAELVPRSFRTVEVEPRRIRVLVGDDTEVGRRLLRRVLEVDPELEVVAVVADGAAAVEAAERLRPQLVLLDAFMPGMDGIAATREIMRRAPAPVVLTTPDLASRAASLAFEATQAGALDFLVPPPFGDPAGAACVAFRDKLKELAEIPVIGRRGGATAGEVARVAAMATPPAVLAICGSTGGPAVLAQLLRDLAPFAERLSILVVQHMLKGFGGTFGEWLESSSGVRVRIPEGDEPLEPGTVLLAPDDRHLVVRARGVAGVTDGEPVGAHRPSGTHLFESAARSYGRELCAVLLTGMGEDGVRGLAAVRAGGGVVLVQSPASCVVPGMPDAAVRAGLPHAVLSPEGIVKVIASSLSDGARS
jgi:two-component system chemotaxis response regulator CheB